ncbi:hypothetical protein [Ferrovibrio sp.]|uniref:hypothetical protein n=1 Tax=Ferrovibrio sp. TaxID=1917215 RepID=UPI003D14AFD3
MASAQDQVLLDYAVSRVLLVSLLGLLFGGSGGLLFGLLFAAIAGGAASYIMRRQPARFAKLGTKFGNWLPVLLPGLYAALLLGLETLSPASGATWRGATAWLWQPLSQALPAATAASGCDAVPAAAARLGLIAHLNATTLLLVAAMLAVSPQAPVSSTTAPRGGLLRLYALPLAAALLFAAFGASLYLWGDDCRYRGFAAHDGIALLLRALEQGALLYLSGACLVTFLSELASRFRFGARLARRFGW